MLNINPINNVKASLYNKKPLSPAFKAQAGDSIEISSDNIPAKIEYAKSKVIEALKNNGTEYMVVVNPDGSIYESQGDNEKCSISNSFIKKGAIAVHGHPEFLPLSTGDLAGFLTSDCDSEIAFMKDGRYSKISKKENCKPPVDNFYSLYEKFERQLNLMALDALGIDYHYNEEDIISMCSDLFPNLQNKSFDEVKEYMKKIGYPLDGTSDEIVKNLKNGVLSFYVLNDASGTKYDKEKRMIIENFDKLKTYLSSPEGILLRNELNKIIAQQYDLVYETDMFN